MVTMVTMNYFMVQLPNQNVETVFQARTTAAISQQAGLKPGHQNNGTIFLSHCSLRCIMDEFFHLMKNILEIFRLSL